MMEARVPGVTVPQISAPPRRVPLGVKLAILNHRGVTGSLNWSIPAAVCLLLSAIAQPLWGARMILIAVGTACLWRATRRSVPRLLYALRSIQRLRWGRLGIGRIALGRFAWKRPQPMKPFDQLLKEWDGLDRRAQFDDAAGCLFGCLGMFVGFPFMLMLGFMLVGSVIHVFNPGVQATGLTLASFMQVVGITMLVMFALVAVAGIIQLVRLSAFGDVIDEYRAPKVPPSDVQAFLRELATAREPAGIRDFPPEEYELELACQVQYADVDKVNTADARARFCPRLKRTGVELLLIHPATPGEVELLVGLPPQVQLAGGEWQRAPVFAPALQLFIAATVLLAALGALVFEAASLALR